MKNIKSFNSWKKFRFIDLFAGIGGLRIPFEELGGKCIFTSENDKYAQNTYEANFGEKPFGDINNIEPSQIPDHDILLAGFPCQPFSIMGDKKGFSDTRGTLFFNIESILKKKLPDAFLLENVKLLRTHDKGRTFRTIMNHLKNIGYYVHTSTLNALDFGLPQKRERIFFVGFRENLKFKFPTPINKIPSLSDVLEDDDKVEKSLFASKKIAESRQKKRKIKPFYPSIWHENKGGNISILPFSCALRAGASYNYLLVNGKRRLSNIEMLRLQGFDDDFKIVVPHSELRRQTGNSVAIPVVREIAKEMLKSLRLMEMAKKNPSQKELVLA